MSTTRMGLVVSADVVTVDERWPSQTLPGSRLSHCQSVGKDQSENVSESVSPIFHETNLPQGILLQS